MTKDSEDRLLREIEAAKPEHRPSAEEWAESERGQRVLAQVLAEAGPKRAERRKEQLPPKTRSWVRRRAVPVAALLAVVLVALSLTLLLADRGAKEETVTGETTSTPAHAGSLLPAGQVTKLRAVEHLMPVLLVVFGGDRAGTTDATALLNMAVERGLITRAEIADGADALPLTQGEYARLLWQAFARFLPEDAGPAGPVDPAASPPEQSALEGLGRAGVIRPLDPPFMVSEPLLPDTEALLLDRVRRAIQGLPSS